MVGSLICTGILEYRYDTTNKGTNTVLMQDSGLPYVSITAKRVI